MAAPTPRAPSGGGGFVAPARRWTAADGVHIDVRGLDPPGPLVAILALIDSMTDASAVFVHHDRDPKMLHPELAERGWAALPIAAPAGEVRLKLERVV
jgi:hypothetical protein